MWPTLWEVPGSPIALHTYGLMVLTGFVSSLVWVQLRAREIGMPLEKLPLAFGAAAVGGFGGAKILYALATGDLDAMFSVSGGLAWYGGLIGGAIAVLAVARPLGFDAWKLADATVPAIVLGGTMGRIGCFFAGCCHGAPIPVDNHGTPLLPDGMLGGQILGHGSFPFISLVFDGGVARFQGVPLYPTQLWQAGGSALLFVLLTIVWRTRRFDGQVAGVFLVTEPVLRFVVEAFRGDHRGYAVALEGTDLPAVAAGADAGNVVAGLTTSQGIAIGMVLLGIVLLVTRRNAGVAPETPSTDAYVDDLVEP